MTLTIEEWLTRIGADVRRLRLDQNLSMHDLAARSGVSRSALANLETGEGATLTTMIRVLRALRQESWLGGLAPAVSIRPLEILKLGHQRQRAYNRRRDRAGETSRLEPAHGDKS